MIACYGFCLLRHANKTGLHVIKLQWHNVFLYTLLHHELPDCSLGQIAFAVFSSAICYHTAALPCKCVVNKRL